MGIYLCKTIASDVAKHTSASNYFFAYKNKVDMFVFCSVRFLCQKVWGRLCMCGPNASNMEENTDWSVFFIYFY